MIKLKYKPEDVKDPNNTNYEYYHRIEHYIDYLWVKDFLTYRQYKQALKKMEKEIKLILLDKKTRNEYTQGVEDLEEVTIETILKSIYEP